MYADWDGLGGATNLGTLYAHVGAGKEVVEFEFDPGAMTDIRMTGVSLDPRRLEREQRAGTADPRYRLLESDYLLGVHDQYRVGALKLRLGEQGDFLDSRAELAAPPFVKLRELEAAVVALDRDRDNTAAAGAQWLRMLIAPGGSLGGARPKASVVDPDGRLWIAKFPSLQDEYKMGAWELVLQTLASRA